MSMPFYVSPEQMMKDRADFARKGIGRGRSVAVIRYADGVLFVSENPSAALHKISEIYDRIAFAAVGRYNEFENLRIAGVRLADMRGYSYDRLDVTGRGLANAYAQTLGTIFSSRCREALRDRDLRRGGRGHARGRPGLSAHLRRPGRRGARRRRDGWCGRVRHEVPRGALHAGAEPRRGPQARRGGAGPQRDRPPRHPGARPRGGRAGPDPQPGAQVQAARRQGPGHHPGRRRVDRGDPGPSHRAPEGTGDPTSNGTPEEQRRRHAGPRTNRPSRPDPTSPPHWPCLSSLRARPRPRRLPHALRATA